MIIEIPKNNINERQYIIDVLFGEFLGLKYSIKINEKINYYKILIEKNTINVEDHFFSLYPNGDYLKKEAIPQQVNLTKNPFSVENDMLILFGNDTFQLDEINNIKTIHCGTDIFASSFYMLSRWEEYVIKDRDNHNRFPAKESLAVKYNFIHRPVVNEYTEILWKMLLFCNITQKRKKRNFQIIPSHDVDHLTKYNSHLRTLGGDVLVRRSLIAFLTSSKNFLANRNPNNSFDLIMNLSEKSGLQSRFYFMAASTNKQYDYEYYLNNKLFIKTINNIKDRGHIIGLHSGYDSYNNSQIFKDEKEKLELSLKDKIYEGRQHYLRFEMPKTWKIWNENNLTIDSSMYYAEIEGFRCGVCYDFKIFDFIEKKQLTLYERPLIMMEGTFLFYQNLSVNTIKTKALTLAERVKKYNGNLVLLWHNSSFYSYPYNKITKVYEELLKI